MLHLFGKEAGQVQIKYLTEDLRMDPTHNVGTFLCLLEWFSEVQLLYPTISSYKYIICLLYDSQKKQII